MTPEQVVAILVLMANLQRTIDAQAREISGLRAQLAAQGEGT